MSDLAPAISSFLERAKAYARGADLALPTVSRKIFNDGKTLARLQEGRDVGVNTLEAASDTLAELEAKLAEQRRQRQHADTG